VSELIPATRVTDEFFSTLGVPPLLGRTFTPDEFNTGSSVVILSHRLWLRRFGGDPNIVNKTLALPEGRVTVVGVMPAQFKLPASAEAWTPVAQDSGEMHLRAARYFETVARLKPNVTPAQARSRNAHHRSAFGEPVFGVGFKLECTCCNVARNAGW